MNYSESNLNDLKSRLFLLFFLLLTLLSWSWFCFEYFYVPILIVSDEHLLLPVLINVCYLHVWDDSAAVEYLMSFILELACVSYRLEQPCLLVAMSA